MSSAAPGTAKLLLSVLILIFVGASGGAWGADSGVSVDPRVAWLKEKAVPLRSIDPADDDFSDLMPLMNSIGKARVVLLGEQTHWDGATFLAKVRLIRFLHMIMGFDVLAWESGTYECTVAEGLLHTDKPVVEAASAGIQPDIWAKSLQVRPLFEYARSTYSTIHPLEMTGVDCQFTGYPPGGFFKELLKGRNSMLTKEQREVLSKCLKNSQLSIEEKRAILPEGKPGLSPLEDLVTQLEKKKAILLQTHSRRDVEFSIRVLGNFSAAERQDAASFKNGARIRDGRMGENIVWLAKHRYPDRKIIVWAASTHNSRNISTVTTPDKDHYKGAVCMGDVAYKALGDEMYSIAFLAYGGTIGMPGKPVEPVKDAPPGSLENLLRQAGKPYQFVDLRSVRNDDSSRWLRQPLTARPFGYMDAQADWTKIFDAFIYTEIMTPSTGVPPAGK
jgi:erythromycin esterase